MISLLFLLPALAIINTTASLQVPLSVHVTGADQPTTGSTTPGFDAATIAGLAGLASTFVYRWKKSDKRADVFKDRTVTAAETTMTQAESLKQTDLGIENMLSGLHSVINMIPGVPDDAKKIIADQLDGWKKDNQAYYENKPAKKTDLSSDPIVKKLGEVQKISEKSDQG